MGAETADPELAKQALDMIDLIGVLYGWKQHFAQDVADHHEDILCR